MTTVFINIGGSEAVSQVEGDGNYYNGLHGIAGSVANLRDASDSLSTGWGAAVTANFNDTTSTGAGYDGSVFASGPMGLMARIRTVEVATAQITITGLNNSATYDITFGANAGITFSPTHIEIGASSVDIIGSGTAEQKTGTILGVSPSGGSIVINFSIGEGGSDVAGLSAIKIVENSGGGTENPGIRTDEIKEPNSDATVADASNVTIAIFDSLANEPLYYSTTGEIVGGRITVDTDLIGIVGNPVILAAMWTVGGEQRFILLKTNVIDLAA